MPQWLKCKYENLSLDPRHPYEKLTVVVCTCYPGAGKWRREEPWGLRAGQRSHIHDLQAYRDTLSLKKKVVVEDIQQSNTDLWLPHAFVCKCTCACRHTQTHQSFSVCCNRKYKGKGSISLHLTTKTWRKKIVTMIAATRPN